MTANREHLAGLELALKILGGFTADQVSDSPYIAIQDCIKEAQSAPEPVQGEAVNLIVERDIMGTMHIKMPAHDGGEPFDFVQVQYRYPYTDNQSTKRLADQIAQLIAGGANTAAATPDAELVALLKEAREFAAAAYVNNTFFGPSARKTLARINAKLAELQP